VAYQGGLLDEQSSDSLNDARAHALAYLENRGFDEDIVRAWRLGLVLEPQPGHERMTGRLAIPYLTPTGVVSANFRCLQDHDCKERGHPKYLAETEGGRRLFGVWNLHPQVDAQIMAVCEGELDTIACTSLGGVPAVGVGGSNNWRKWYATLLTGFSEVIVLADPDEAGQGLARQITGAVNTARTVTLPPGLDVNGFLVERGKREFRKAIGLDIQPAE
jgi:DNA primase